MDQKKLTSLWQTILDLEPRLLVDDRLPLVHIEKYLSFYKLPPSPLPEFESKSAVNIHSAQPSYKNLSAGILFALRQNLYEHTEIDSVALWAEKLMRFCEVRMSSLRKRAFTKWGNKAVAKNRMLELTAFLLDTYFYSDDLRYLNTVLKLSDLKWILNTQKIQPNLTKKDERVIAALFEFRIILLTSYALDRLHPGKTR